MQRTLWVVGIGLVLLISGIAWFVLRSVTAPISEAADTSAKLAAGQLDVRLPVHGEDELATLGRSFNAMADSIESQIKELAELSLVQQRFVSDVSHELRTPMTTIRLAADMINDQRDDFDPATARAAELLNAQVQRFETLLTDLLEISRYDAGSVQLELEPTSLAHLAEDVIGSMQQLAEQHGTDVRLVAPGGYSPVEMDPRRVRRVVRNLLGNAIEHGEGRPIVVTVDSDQQAVAIGVRDFGLGMKPEDVEHVFDRFWRADPSRTRTIGGTGLGLSIALGDAKLHGGELAVWSEPGRGTNFVLTLPRQGAPLNGASPIPVDPGDDAVAPLEDLGLTAPIEVPHGSRAPGGGRATAVRPHREEDAHDPGTRHPGPPARAVRGGRHRLRGLPDRAARPSTGWRTAERGDGSQNVVVPPQPAAARRHPAADRRGLHRCRLRAGRHGQLGPSRGSSSRRRSRKTGCPRRASSSMSAPTGTTSRPQEGVVDFASEVVASVDDKGAYERADLVAGELAVPPRAAAGRRVAHHRGARRHLARRGAVPDGVPSLPADVLRSVVAVPRARRPLVPGDESGRKHRRRAGEQDSERVAGGLRRPPRSPTV